MKVAHLSEGGLTVAVTGLNATDNPGPGVAVVRALREDPAIQRVVGLVYDALEPGIYASDLLDDVYLIPYPSQGPEALKSRLGHVIQQVGLDVILPTLDSEIPLFIALEPTLRELGVGMFLPTRDQFDLRSKVHLQQLGLQTGIVVPKQATVGEVSDLYELREPDFPWVLKGLFYGARVARTLDEAVRAFHSIVAQWGLPVLVQEFVSGEEYDVVAAGDGEGGLIGALPMKKMFLTDKGKGWAGIAIKDPELLDLTKRFVEASHWRGPCEVEIIKGADGTYQLLEINPRFPAWCYLCAGAGMNLPAAIARLAAGQQVEPMTHFEVGAMFVRISLDQIARLSDFEQLSTLGQLSRWSDESKPHE